MKEPGDGYAFCLAKQDLKGCTETARSFTTASFSTPPTAWFYSFWWPHTTASLSSPATASFYLSGLPHTTASLSSPATPSFYSFWRPHTTASFSSPATASFYLSEWPHTTASLSSPAAASFYSSGWPHAIASLLSPATAWFYLFWKPHTVFMCSSTEKHTGFPHWSHLHIPLVSATCPNERVPSSTNWKHMFFICFYWSHQWEPTDTVIIIIILALARTFGLEQTVCCIKSPMSRLLSTTKIFKKWQTLLLKSPKLKCSCWSGR